MGKETTIITFCTAQTRKSKEVHTCQERKLSSASRRFYTLAVIAYLKGSDASQESLFMIFIWY